MEGYRSSNIGINENLKLEVPDIKKTMSNQNDIVDEQCKEIDLLVECINQMKDKISIITKPKENGELVLKLDITPSSINASEMSDLNKALLSIGMDFRTNMLKIRKIRLFVQNLINNLDL